MPSTSDEDLFVAFCERRDVESLSTLFRRRADELLRLAVFLAPRPTDAEDLVQATFLSAIARAETYRRDHRVMSWLCGILTNHARMLRRAERRRDPEPTSAADEATPIDAALQSELQRALRDGIAALKQPYRSVLLLHLEGGLTSQQIGEQLHQKPATVRKQMARAIEQLRTALPLGLATALVMQMSPAQIASRAAEAAQFVASDADGDAFESDEPMPAEPIPATGMSALRMTAMVAAAVVTIAAMIVWWPTDDNVPTEQAQATPPPTERAASRHGQNQVAPTPIDPAVPQRTRNDGTTLLVRAIDPDGQPLTGIELLCLRDDGRPFPVRAIAGSARQATTDGDGHALFSGLPRGCYELAIAGATPKAQVRIDRDHVDHTLLLPQRHHHRGYVTDPDGRPVTGALVLVSETAGRGDLPAVLTRTDATGQYDAPYPITAGIVFARHPDYGQSHGYRIAAERQLHLELEALPPRVQVRVRTSDGANAAGALVALVPKSQDTAFHAPHLARADSAGMCTLAGPGPRHASVLVQQPGYAPTTADLALGRSQIDVELRAPARIAGTARAPDGTPLANREIVISLAGARTNEPTAPMLARRVRTDDAGRFAAADVPRAVVQVRIHGSCANRLGPPMSQFIVAGLDVDTRDGDRTDLELQAPESPSVRGSLSRPSGVPIVGWHLVAVPDEGTAAHRMLRRRVARTDADGRFELPSMAPGETYQVGFYPPECWWPNPLNWPILVAEARVGEDCEVVIATTHRATATMSCQALRPDGRPARRATFELRMVGFQTPQTCTADASGGARFGPLPSGEYWLVVRAPGLGARTIPVHVADRDRKLDLGTIQLQRPARLAVRIVAPPAAPVSGLRVVAKNTIGDKFVAARTTPQGQAALRPLPPGPSSVLVYGHGVAPALLERELEPGVQWLDVETVAATPVTLRFPFPLADNPFVINGPLHVRIHDAAGRLVLEDFLGATTARGRFDLMLGLPPGTYRVQARSIWNALADRTLVVGNEALEHELPLRL